MGVIADDTTSSNEVSPAQLGSAGAPTFDDVETVHRRVLDQLLELLLCQLNVVVAKDSLESLAGFVLTSPMRSRPTTFVLSDDLKGAAETSTLAHMACHLLLGHTDRPCATILEPRRGDDHPQVRVEDWEIEQGEHADELMSTVLAGSAQEVRQVLWERSLRKDEAARERDLTIALLIRRTLLATKHQKILIGLRNETARRIYLRILGKGRKVFRNIYHGRFGKYFSREILRLREMFVLIELADTIPDHMHDQALSPVRRMLPVLVENRARRLIWSVGKAERN